MEPRVPPESRYATAPPPHPRETTLRPELHALIETLPDAVLLPLRDLLRQASRELTLSSLLLVVETMQQWY